MAKLTVRTANLDDAAAITAIHTSNVGRWQRLNEDGIGEDAPYERLTIYERWLYGGPWMSIETCAVHLSHLRRGAGIPVVAELDGRVVGHGEAFHGQEPKPFGNHLHVSVLFVHVDAAGQGVEQALLAHMVALARDLGCDRVCIGHAEAEAFYSGEGWQRLTTTQHVTWPARTGQVFYQAVPHPNADPAQIHGWSMPLGRGQSARQEWISRWPELWSAVPELRNQHVERLKLSVAGANFYVMYTASPYDPRWASVHLWTGTPLTGPMLTAVNDKAHKLGFRRLDSVVVGEFFGFLGTDVETDGYPQDVFSIELGAR